MAKTFAELGIPFPLFEAPVEDAAEYNGMGTCSLCGRAGQHCFTLEIGCAVVALCPACGTENYLDADDRVDEPCRSCRRKVPFPDFGGEEIQACYDCLRAGKAAITKDTELGMISWEQALEGITNGKPGLKGADFELVPTETDWVRARVPQEMTFELLRTPTYVSIQGEIWQFCCRQPMVFLGAWSRKEFTRRAPDGDGRKYFESIVQDPIPGLWEDRLHDETGAYVFRCPECGRMTAHWDIA